MYQMFSHPLGFTLQPSADYIPILNEFVQVDWYYPTISILVISGMLDIVSLKRLYNDEVSELTGTIFISSLAFRALVTFSRGFRV
jgi:hypothetical protein